ncbi:hypothetical protein [Spirosoma sp. KUDC1026]|uniref:hypothetical protein n=1 Tax=Spirosoma sp. KUDC1026 TaxID=2745947 RepID=UPI00159B9167|nr:hypothetical protein [Spirosoma sp. KUDC1026]QKZ13762.1 hypothetical protein HU175_14425 [Spirosoma sp. KUDC1026]
MAFVQTHETPPVGRQIYQVYNRGVNRAPIFDTTNNYRYFLKQYALYLGNYVDTQVYCLTLR